MYVALTDERSSALMELFPSCTVAIFCKFTSCKESFKNSNPCVEFYYIAKLAKVCKATYPNNLLPNDRISLLF